MCVVLASTFPRSQVNSEKFQCSKISRLSVARRDSNLGSCSFSSLSRVSKGVVAGVTLAQTSSATCGLMTWLVVHCLCWICVSYMVLDRARLSLSRCFCVCWSIVFSFTFPVVFVVLCTVYVKGIRVSHTAIKKELMEQGV